MTSWPYRTYVRMSSRWLPGSGRAPGRPVSSARGTYPAAPTAAQASTEAEAPTWNASEQHEDRGDDADDGRKAQGQADRVDDRRNDDGDDETHDVQFDSLDSMPRRFRDEGGSTPGRMRQTGAGRVPGPEPGRGIARDD